MGHYWVDFQIDDSPSPLSKQEELELKKAKKEYERQTIKRISFHVDRMLKEKHPNKKFQS